MRPSTNCTLRAREPSTADRVRVARRTAGAWKDFPETGAEYVERIRGSRRLSQIAERSETTRAPTRRLLIDHLRGQGRRPRTLLIPRGPSPAATKLWSSCIVRTELTNLKHFPMFKGLEGSLLIHVRPLRIRSAMFPFGYRGTTTAGTAPSVRTRSSTRPASS